MDDYIDRQKDSNKVKILIVDDEQHIRSSLARALRQLGGYYTEEASSGEEALALLEMNPYDILFLDLIMPGLSGEAVMRQACHMQPELKIIILTGNASLGSAIIAMKCGAVGYFLKPESVKTLLEKVKEVVKYEGNSEKENEVKRLRAQVFYLSNALQKLEKQPAEVILEGFPLNQLRLLTQGVVHDIRGGLGIIRTIMGFLKDDLSESANKSDVQKVFQSLDFCELVLRNLSNLSGPDLIQPEWVELEAIIREVYSILERKLVDVDLIINVDPHTPKVLADVGQMKQVFMNLFQNAGEAMPDGGTITIRIQCEEDMLRVDIIDTGCGIAAHDQQKLFKEFFTTKKQGYGLGLHIVHTIISNYGGKIEVNSEVGQGTNASLYLPIEPNMELRVFS